MKKLSFIFIIMFLLSFQLYSQWQLLNSPVASPSIKFVDYHPNGYLIAISDDKKVFKSDSTLTNWIKIGNLEFNPKCIKISSSGIIYAGIIGGYACSSDGGYTWTYKLLFSSTERFICDIEFNSIGYIFMIQNWFVQSNGVWISTDFGENWNKSTIGLPSSGFILQEIFKDSFNDLYIFIYNYGLYKSTDNGGSWFFTTFCSNYDDIAIDSENNLYASYYSGIYKSNDFGNNWNLVNGNIQGLLYIDSFDNIYCLNHKLPGLRRGIIYSSDAGANWQEVGFGGISGNNMVCLDSTNIYLSTNVGLLKSTDKGSNWSLCFKDYEKAASISDLMILPDNTILTSSPNAGLFISFNNFSTWDTTNLITGVNQLKKDNIGNLYASSTYLYRSTNYGLNWNIPYNSEYPKNMTNLFINDSCYIFAIQPYGIYAGSFASVFKSEDFGLTWEYIWANTLACDGGSNGYSCVESFSGTLFISHYFSGCYPHPVIDVSIIKFELGNEILIYNWEIANNMYLYNQSLYLATQGYDFHPSLGIIKSSDNGNTFFSLNNGLTDLNIKQLILRPEIFLALTSNGIFQSVDEGNFWSPISINGLNFTINKIYLDDNQILYACTDNGIYVYRGILDVEDKIAPTKFSLEQNYPNPFNPSTSIQYTISSRQFVTLKVYDVLGKEVATLVNEEKAAGSYEVEFQSSVGSLQLASSIYYYQLKAGDYIETKKMILMK